MVRGVSGHVEMRTEFILRFDYGSVVPWMERLKGGGGLRAIAGPEMAVLRTPVHLHGRNFTTVGEFTIGAGQVVPFVLSYGASQSPPPPEVDALAALQETEAFWREWSERCAPAGDWTEDVRRSLVVLKGLTYAPTGGIVAAPTTSLPEQAGGVRNWDYRYCWLRDATFTLQALGSAGYTEEAREWRDWLLRAVAGRPDQLQIMYGLGGERRLTEWEVPWLPGFEGAARFASAMRPPRSYSWMFMEKSPMRCFRRAAWPATGRAVVAIGRAFLDHLEMIWREPDEGIWEVRGPRQHFTHSKVMAWVAFDRAVKAVEQLSVDGPIEHWRGVRDAIHADVCQNAFDHEMGSFVQAYGSKTLDASLLLLAIVGFLPPSDPRIVGTVRAIEDRLLVAGSSSAMTPAKRKTVCRQGRRPFSPAVSGSWTISFSRAVLLKRAPCSSACWRFATMSDCWRKSTIRRRFARWEIFRRRSAMSLSSTRPTISPATWDRPKSAPVPIDGALRQCD